MSKVKSKSKKIATDITSLNLPQINNQDTSRDKQIAYYAAIQQAWISTRMEQDKTVITLASAGIGLSITILTAVEIKDKVQLLFFAGAILSFLVSIISSLFVFRLSANLLSEEIKIINQNKDELANDKWLKVSEYIMIISFGIGVIFFLIIGLQSIYNKMH